MGKKANALANYKSIKKDVKAKAMIKAGKHEAKKDPFANRENDILELTSHAGLLLATQQVPDGLFGIKELKPDTMAVAGGIMGTLLLKGGWQRRSYAIGKGAAHACISRWGAGRTKVTMSPDGTVTTEKVAA